MPPFFLHLPRPSAARLRLVLAGFLAACVLAAQAQNSLLGTYYVMDQGQLKEFIRLYESSGKQVIAEKQSGRWINPTHARAMGKTDLAAILKQNVTVPVTGMGSDMIAVFQVPRGWRAGHFTCNTGYFVATVLGPVELHRK